MHLPYMLKIWAERLRNRIAVLTGDGWGEFALVSLIAVLLGAMAIPTFAIIDGVMMRLIVPD